MSRLQEQLRKWMETSDFTPYVHLKTPKERQILYEFLVHHKFRWNRTMGTLVEETSSVLLGRNCKSVMPAGFKHEARMSWASNLPDVSDRDNWARFYPDDDFREMDVLQFLRFCKDIQTTDICG